MSINVPIYTSLHQLIQSIPLGDAPAIYAPGREPMTYNGLKKQLDSIVGYLNKLGIGRNDAVAVVVPNGPEMAVSFLSIMAGAVCAPLNPNYQTKEYEFYLQDLEAKALVLPEDLDNPAREAAAKLGIPVFHLKASTQGQAGAFQLEGQPIDKPCSGGFSEAGDVALILHTSGTTSRPKIVPLSQANVMRSAHNVGRSLALTPGDRSLNVMPLFHIHGLIASLLASLNAGGSVVCTPGFAQESFWGWVTDFAPTWYTAVPTIHQSVLAAAEREPALLNAFKMRFIRSCSSSLAPQVMKRMEDLFHVPVVEAYGMTEAAHQISCNPLAQGAQKAGSVGIPAGPEAAIMDKTGGLLQQGETGEIVIKGTNVTAGYRNNPKANEENFTQGWFRTGDQGFMDEEGYITITGRLKEQINQGGEKISPREIDEVLMDHDAVNLAVTFAVPHERLGEVVAVAVVFKEGKQATESELKSFASKRLADFKVPRRIVFTHQIPKGPTGKLQRIGLHEKLPALVNPGYVPAETETEFRLAALWSQLLAIKKVGRLDNFFILGGDSILATKLVVRINAELNTEISISQLFLYPSPADLGSFIDQSPDMGDSDEFSQLLSEVEDLEDGDPLTLLE